jgi:phosphomevalonate kinase
VIATAPGKLILTGEYAVLIGSDLGGAPALVVAVDRRVIARRRTGPRGSSPFLVAVVEELARRFGADHPAPHKAMEIVCDSRAFFAGPIKLGLGSSAAVTVAATALALAGDDEAVPVIDRDTVQAVAAAAHAAAQSLRRRERDSGAHMIIGLEPRRSAADVPIATTSRDSATHMAVGGVSPAIRGSGADIAAAVHGGVIAFETGQPVTRMTWPARVRLVPFFTGEPADTAELIARVMAAREAGPGVDAALTAIAKASRAACQACDIRTPEIAANALIAALALAAEATDQLARASDLPLVPPVVTQVRNSLARHGGTAKTTGAGGGDVAIAVLPASEDPAIAERSIIEAGGRPLGLAVDAAGVDLQPVAQ